ncbi:hypothetical protein C0991_001672 [Blastosporella zonata]|nr:hypothetical protein C0991_001672 [Blastosporella zonata]
MNVGDREFGKGRHDNSSLQAKKRSFSPTSDDGDLVIPPIADDDTPPPPERPLLRQPVAFAWSGTTTTVAVPPALNTYEMVISPVTGRSQDTLFLPGQAVVRNPPPPARRKKNQTDGPSRKKKKTNDYGGQTTRFRLEAYTSTAPSEPNIAPSPSSSTVTLRGNSGTPTVASASSPTPTSASSCKGGNVSIPLLSPPVEAHSQQIKWNIKHTSTHAGPNRLPAVSARPSPSNPIEAPEMRERSSSYYRRDYEKNLAFHEPEARQYPAPGQASVRASGLYETNPPSRTGRQSSLPTTHRHHEERIKGELVNTSDLENTLNVMIEGRRIQKTPLLMLTLLIQDIRSGVVDHQLAEVKVPMKAANDPKDGFWADAKLLGQQLQSSASRIDGPAKVYTLRGKYRQFFLRVSAENRDEFISTHLAIKPDRMLDVVVEELLPPGQLPYPPKIPRDLIARSLSPDSSSGSPSPERDLVSPPSQRERKYEDTGQHHQKGFQRSLSPDNSRGRKSQKSQSPKHTQNSGCRSRSSSSVESIFADLISENAVFQPPMPGDSPEEVQRLILQAVDTIIQDDDGWEAFFRAKSALEPHRAMDVLAQYYIVKRMMDQFVGKKIPFRSYKANIESCHITGALKIDDPNFVSACVETLGLLDLYGEKGRHYADPRVIEIVKDSSRQEYNAKPIKRLLHLMRDIDKKWKEEHPAAKPVSAENGDFMALPR